ncbi:MAG TPA: hypothetical protein VFW66_07125 [Gemmatimonadales bacterium]|nr:hypothetical protein [Gemmatimonadales bacterium]
MPIPLRLDTDDITIAFDIMSMNGSLQPGATVTTPGGGRLRFDGRVPAGQGGGSSGRLDFELLDLPSDAAAPVAAWLSERLNGRVATVRVGGVAVPAEPDALRRALGGRA